MKKLCWFNLYFLLMTILSFENGFAQDYETPPVLKSANLLPPELVKSEVHRIHDDVTTDGCFYHFTMESCFGMYDVESMDLLKIRIHEVQTLANVIEKNQSDEFFQGLGKRMHQTISTPVKMIQDPVGAISALGQGIEKKFQRIGNRFKSKETRPQEDSGIRANLIDKEKRELAAELNLDVYSTNPKVQEF